MDEIDDHKTVGKSLHKVIETGAVSDWRKYFIEIPELIDETGVSEYIRKESDKNVLLLNTSTTAG